MFRPVFTINLVKSYKNDEIWSKLAKYYGWYEVRLSLRVRVTTKIHHPPAYAWDRKSENTFRRFK